MIHTIWLGGKPLPYPYVQNLSILRDLNEEEELVLWTEENRPTLLNEDLFDSEKSLAGKADLLRLELLFSLGGYYSDCDVRWFKPLKCLNLPEDKLSVVRESHCVLNNAFLHCPPNNPEVLRLIELCRTRSRHSVVPVRYGPGLINQGYRENPEAYYVVSNLDITTPSTAGPEGRLRPEAVAFHAYSQTWLSCLKR